MSIAAWIVLLASILVTLVFSVANYTLRNSSRVKLEDAFGSGRGDRRLKYLDERLDEFLLATGAVRTLAQLFTLVALMHDLPLDIGWGKELVRLAIAAILVWIFGVGIPHAWSKYGGERALAMAWPALKTARWLLRPLSGVLGSVDLPVRRLSGHDERSNGKASEVEQEILQIVSEGAAEEGVDADELEMINSVIEFHDIRAGEIMTPRTDMEALPVEADRDKCVHFVLDKGHSRIPVYEDTLDSVIGVLYAKDLLAVEANRQNSEEGEAGPFDLGKVMREPFFVPETKAISDLLKEFRSQKVHMAIVLDEYGGTAGLITIEDLVEEIVGDITDEYEQPDPEMFQAIDEHSYEVDARMYVDDFNDELDVELPEEEDYDTIGGFVFSTLGSIPQIGDSFEHDGLEFTVLEAEQRKINRLRIVRKKPGGDKSEKSKSNEKH